MTLYPLLILINCLVILKKRLIVRCTHNITLSALTFLKKKLASFAVGELKKTGGLQLIFFMFDKLNDIAQFQRQCIFFVSPKL